ncbi:hypothetical protein [uncultured Metabacillus sp.]|uniref:hypothetical protein n=1 Tax=Metabacillus sp. Hm71 TaxID=3450743 RepID=UPI0026050A7E|nr:hypothetical protein [uncultured Metabacillus sp.]
MKFKVSVASEDISKYILFLNEFDFELSEEYEDEGYIIINTLEDLIKLRTNIGQSLILGQNSITIYDDWME